MRVLGAIVLVVLLFAIPAQAGTSESTSYNAKVIRHVFGGYGDQAVRVAYCESRLHVWSTNGQYWGLFQMGSFARAKYGHAWNAWAESRAAYRYFRDSGRNWSPWSCKP